MKNPLKPSCSRNLMVLVGYDTAGYLTGLEKGFQQLDFPVISFMIPNEYAYESLVDSEKQPRGIHIFKAWLSSYRVLRSTFAPLVRILRLLLKAPVLVKISREGHSIYYNSGNLITGSNFEIALLRRSGVKVFFIFHGSEVRPRYLDGAAWMNGEFAVSKVRKSVREQVKLVSLAEKYGDFIVCWSGITHFFSRRVYLHEDLGFPLATWKRLVEIRSSSTETTRSESTLRLLHAPSNPFAKGSSRISAAIQDLREQGFKIEVDFVTGMGNAELLDRITQADIVIDQIYSDTMAGVLAGEASMLGKTVLVATPHLTWFEKNMSQYRPSSILIETDKFELELKELCIKHLHSEVEEVQSNFFENRWNPTSVATKYLAVAEGLHSETSIDPLLWVHARGGYASQSALNINVREYVARYGERALHLSHNPELENAVLLRCEMIDVNQDEYR